MTVVEAVEVLHQLLPLKIMACCYDNKNTNTAWPTIPVKNLKYPEIKVDHVIIRVANVVVDHNDLSILIQLPQIMYVVITANLRTVYVQSEFKDLWLKLGINLLSFRVLTFRISIKFRS